MEVENQDDLSTLQKDIIEERLNNHYKNPNHLVYFDKTLADIEKTV